MKKINYNLFEDLIGTQYTDMEYIKRIQIGVFTPMTNHISSITMVEELDI